jgi:hypothetical protein
VNLLVNGQRQEAVPRLVTEQHHLDLEPFGSMPGMQAEREFCDLVVRGEGAPFTAGPAAGLPKARLFAEPHHVPKETTGAAAMGHLLGTNCVCRNGTWFRLISRVVIAWRNGRSCASGGRLSGERSDRRPA